jgi:hypothetical protein
MTTSETTMTTDDRLDHLEQAFGELCVEVSHLRNALVGSEQFRTKGVMDTVQENTKAVNELSDRVASMEQAMQQTKRFFGLFGVADLKSLLTIVSLVFALGKGFNWW